jgi:hypothetical protein
MIITKTTTGDKFTELFTTQNQHKRSGRMGRKFSYGRRYTR